jgi:hypothetical protein
LFDFHDLLGMQRSLFACKGMTSSRITPQLEVAANRVIGVGGLYFYPGKPGSKKQKSVMYKQAEGHRLRCRSRVERREEQEARFGGVVVVVVLVVLVLVLLLPHPPRPFRFEIVGFIESAVGDKNHHYTHSTHN